MEKLECYKFQTIEEVKNTPEYAMYENEIAINGFTYYGFELFDIILNYLGECKEFVEKQNKAMHDYFNQFVDIQDLGKSDLFNLK